MAAIVGTVSPPVAWPVACRHAQPGSFSRVVLCGSPRLQGRSARLAQQISDSLAARYPDDYVILLPVAHADVHGCVGCGHCREAGECVFDDDMASVMEALDNADELHVVSPVYFAGPPSQLKAVLDRLQPHYWKETRKRPKRPAHLHVVGEGGDPHGFEPLVVSCRSALAVAGFHLESVTPHIARTASPQKTPQASCLPCGEGALPLRYPECSARRGVEASRTVLFGEGSCDA